MRKQLTFILLLTLLSACITEDERAAPVASRAATPAPVEVVTKEQKKEVENVTWKLPEWCKDLEQKFNQVQVCGVAIHNNLQMSRTRSELDARKQLARRVAGHVDETITETTGGSRSEMRSTAILTSKSEVGRYIIENQKTIPSEGKYLTFTKVVQYFN